MLLIFIIFLMIAKPWAVTKPPAWELKVTCRTKKMRKHFHTYVNCMPQGNYFRQDLPTTLTSRQVQGSEVLR